MFFSQRSAVSFSVRMVMSSAEPPSFVVGLGWMQESYHVVVLFPCGNNGLRIRRRGFIHCAFSMKHSSYPDLQTRNNSWHWLRSPEDRPIVWVLMETWISFFKRLLSSLREGRAWVCFLYLADFQWGNFNQEGTVIGGTTRHAALSG